MFPQYIPTEAEKLTEETSIAIIKEIKLESISTPFKKKSIGTTYIKKGKGKTPILLIHGFDSSLLEFRRLFPLLAQDREIWAVDLYGFGFSDRDLDSNYNTEQIKTHLYYFWKTLINKPIIIAGASMGGATGIDFTITHPEIVEKLILIDSAGLIKQPIISKFMFSPLDYWATEFLRNPSIRQSISKSAYYDKSFASLDAQLCAALHLKCDNWNKALIQFTKSGGYGSFAKELKEIKQPTLILWGRQDKILGIKDAPKFAKLIPNNKLVWIDKCGHVPHLEKARETSQEILNYLSQS